MVDDELTGKGTQRELSGTASYKGKAKISNDTYGLGSQPWHANTYAHSLEQYTPLRGDFPISRTCQAGHITATTSVVHAETSHLLIDSQHTHTPDTTWQSAPSTTRRRSNLNRGRTACSQSTQTAQVYAHQNRGIVMKDMADDKLTGYGENGGTPFFLTFTMRAAVVEMVFKFAGGNHVRFARNDSSGATCASSLVGRAATVPSLRLARKQIPAGVHSG